MKTITICCDYCSMELYFEGIIGGKNEIKKFHTTISIKEITVGDITSYPWQKN